MKEGEDGGVIVISAELWGWKGRGGRRGHMHFWHQLRMDMKIDLLEESSRLRQS
jgi:hypothetical protein